MHCYLITRYEIQEGRFVSTYDAGSLPAVIAEARRLVAQAKGLECEVFVDKPDGQSLNYLSVVLRQRNKGQTVAVFKAERGRTQEVLEAGILGLADIGTRAEVLRDFILSGQP